MGINQSRNENASGVIEVQSEEAGPGTARPFTGIGINPHLERSLRRMYTSHRTSNCSANTAESRGTQETNSSINDAFSPEVTNMACAYGNLRFRNGALFQGIICNRLQGFGQDEYELKQLDTSVATFMTAVGECLHGTFIFQRLQYDLEVMTPVAVYFADLQIILIDTSVHAYKGPLHILLKQGKAILPLAKSLLQQDPLPISKNTTVETKNVPPRSPPSREEAPKSHRQKNDAAAAGKLLLRLSLGEESDNLDPPSSLQKKEKQPFPMQVQYAKYPLCSPRVASNSVSSDDGGGCRNQNGLTRFQTTSTVLNAGGSGSNSRVRRDHRMLFWSLCGKEMAPSKWDEYIDSDLRRTYFHRFLDRSADSAREQLHSILRYVAVAFPNIGYCQGMHCVAKYLLIFSEAPVADSKPNASEPTAQVHSPKNDKALASSVSLETETAFVLFAQLLEDERYRLQDLFHPSFTFFRGILDDLDQQLWAKEPVLFAHLQQLGLSAVVYGTKWILTLFTFYVDQDFSSVTNVWLRFLSQGWDALLQIAFACVVCVKEHLMNSDSEGCLLILSGTTEVTPHGILETVFGTTRGQALLREPYVQTQISSNAPTFTALQSGHSASDLPAATNPQAQNFVTVPLRNTPTLNTKSADSERPPSPPVSALPSEQGSPFVSRAVPNRRYTHD